jgi:hypothetical protein
MMETENDRLYSVRDELAGRGAYSQKAESDGITECAEAQKTLRQSRKKPRGEVPCAFPDRDPSKKKTGEF